MNDTWNNTRVKSRFRKLCSYELFSLFLFITDLRTSHLLSRYSVEFLLSLLSHTLVYWPKAIRPLAGNTSPLFDGNFRYASFFFRRLVITFPSQIWEFFLFQATGDMSDLINDRLSCGATFDFLDYIQPDTTGRYPSQYSQYSQYYQRRTFHLPTGAILLTGITISWVNVAIWVFIAFFALFCNWLFFG